MSSHSIDPRVCPIKVPIIAHDVGRTNDRSTAVVGGHCEALFGPDLLLVQDFNELPLGIYGTELANELAKVDQRRDHNCLIVADLSNDATYGEVLFDTFGRRLIGVQISHSGDGTTCQHRRVGNGAIPVYNVGRSYLIELLLAEFHNRHIRLSDSPQARRAYEQLTALEPEQRESRILYKCPAGQHDDLAMSLAMLAWAAKHLHLKTWQRPIFDAHRPRPQSSSNSGWLAHV